MKTTKSKLLIALLLIFSSAAYVYATEITKSLHKEFDVNQNSVLVLKNKYGKIDVQNWDKNLVVIDVKIRVEHPNKETAQKLLDYLNVEFSESGKEIKAVTVINERFSKGNKWGNNKEFSIDYTVKMPKSLDIKLSNKYGDTFIDELTGHAAIEIKYGNLQANKILRDDTKPLSFVILGYSKGIIEQVNWLKVIMKYSKLEIETSRAMVVESKYSKLYVDEASSIVAESKYDTYRIGKTDNFVITGSYSDYKLDYVGKKLYLETKYTGTTVEKMPTTFEKIDIQNGYGGVKLGIASGASYYLKGEARYANISFPSGGKMNRIQGNTSSSYEGTVGSDSDPKAKVTIKTSYGSVKLDY